MTHAEKILNHFIDGRDVEHLLMLEEYEAERKIGIARFLIYGLCIVELWFLDYNEAGDRLWSMWLPYAFGWLISAILLVDILLAGTKKFRKHFNQYYKYVLIPLDVVMMSAVIYNLYASSSLVESADWGIPFYYAIASALLSFAAILRFSVFVAVYTGLLCLVGLCTTVLFFYGTADLGQFIFQTNGNFQIPNLSGVWAIAMFTAIASLAADRGRQVIIRTKRQEKLERFLPTLLAQDVLAGRTDWELGGRRTTVSVLFADIRDFTTFSEQNAPEEVINFLNSYFNDMIEVVFKYNGLLDKIIGDAIMAVYGVNHPPQAGAEQAVQSAIDMLNKLESLNELRKFHNQPPIQIGIGIHTGEVILGNVGNQKRMDFTAIGDTVNTASRLEGLTKNLDSPILISRQTRSMLNGAFQLKAMGDMQLKGKAKTIEVFGVA